MKVRLHSQSHEWRETDEYGELRIIRAEWDSRSWTFQVTTKKDTEWHTLEKGTLAEYEALRDVMWRKYQRKRLSWKFIEDLDVYIANLKNEG